VQDSQIYSPANFDSARTGTRRETTVPFAGGNRRAIYYPIEVDSEVQAIIEVSESLVPTERALNQARISFLVAGTLALPAGLLAGWWMARQALIPVNRLTAAVGTLAASGEFDQRVAQPGADDEIGRLARTFNDILERLTVVLDRQQTLVADTSHELRNPLMVVRGNLDLLVHDLPADQRQEAVTEAREEVDRMARLVGDLLFLADADTAGSIQRAHVELDDILAEIMHDVQMVSPGHIVQLEANDEVSVLGDAERLRQLVWNLVENAMRYTPAGGTIILSLRRRARVAEIGVTDTGIGIPEEHLPHIFDRFYRVDRGRSRALGGTGLGLSIVRQVAEAHGGQVRVRSTVGVGTTFTVFLPMTEAPETLADAIG
jgi:signal transduction histidine kinase